MFILLVFSLNTDDITHKSQSCLQESVTKDLDRLLKNQAHLETKMKNFNQIM